MSRAIRQEPVMRRQMRGGARAVRRITRARAMGSVTSVRTRAIVVVALASLAAAAAQPAAAQRSAAQRTRGEIETFHVQGNVYALIGTGANVAVQIGADGVLVVDTGIAETRDRVLAAIRELSDGPIRWIVNTHAHVDHTGGNETISQAGMTVNGNPAAIIAHERVLARMSEADRPITEWPLNTFFESRRDFAFNGEAIFLYHVPAAHTDGDVVVHFRESDVIVAGGLFSTTHYPIIDLESGGGIDGFIAGLNAMLDLAVPDYLQEGGTYVIPGHGRICDEADVLEYRDMVKIVRDRIADMIDRGLSLADVQAARPALDYDTRYGSAPDWDSAMFVEAVYRDLRARGGSR